MKHNVMVHQTEYKNKPIQDAGKIQNQIYAKKNHKRLTIAEIGAEAIKGKTFKSGFFSGKNKTDYIDYTSSLLVLDVDNKYTIDGITYYTDYTIDDAINMCESNHLDIALIYTTFSHDDNRHKFRMIFQLNRTVSMDEWNNCLDIIKSIITIADKQVHNGHYTYGGQNIVLIDESAVLNVDELLKKSNGGKKSTKKDAQSIDNTSLEREFKITPQSINVFNNINKIGGAKQICDRNLVNSTLREHFESEFFPEIVKKIKEKQFYTVWAAIQYLRTIPLGDILGVSNKLNCLFHEDKKPSAGIGINTMDGTWYYHCFSCGVTYGLVDFVAMAYGFDKVNECSLVFDKIIELFEIEIVPDVHKQSWAYNFFNNEMYFSKAERYKKQYPLTSAGMVFSDGLYTIILREARIALEYSSAKDINGMPLTSISRRYLMQRTGLNRNKYDSRHQRLLNMGLIRILSDDEVKAISKDLYETSKVGGEKQNTISIYAIYPIDLKLLEQSEERLRRFKECGATTKGATGRQSLAIYDGKDNTFAKSKGDTEKIIKDRAILMEWARKELSRKECIVKEKYLTYAKKKGYGEKYASTFIVEIVKKYNLKKKTCSNESIKKYGLPKSALRKVIFVKES